MKGKAQQGCPACVEGNFMSEGEEQVRGHVSQSLTEDLSEYPSSPSAVQRLTWISSQPISLPSVQLPGVTSLLAGSN